MISDKWHIRMRMALGWLERHARQIWYPYLAGFLAALDNFVIVIPTDGILISSTMLTPRRWLLLAFVVAVGSTLGATLLAALVEFHGLPWILNIYPGVQESQAWELSTRFFDDYGLLLVFIVAVTPLMQQPAVILASLAAIPLTKLALVIFIGRFMKYLLMSYLASHAPRLLRKMWGIRGELRDTGLDGEV